jgi:4-diphosphocytidyl-2-C-methyl-D-erythritol kinase
MNFRRDDLARTIRTPAKLNLYLEVLGRRDDGYHELETLMVPVQIWDSLSMRPLAADSRGVDTGALRFSFHSQLPTAPREASQSTLPSGEDNLVVRALKLLGQRSGCVLGADVELVKRIPLEAGLGGGSSDAAAALVLANRVWGIHWEQARLEVLAAELGSDVPFFVSRRPAICRGRGERIERLPPMPRLDFVVVRPPAGLATRDVYRAYDERRPTESIDDSRRQEALADVARRGRWGDLRRWMTNRLQAAAASLSPWVEEARAAFARLDCVVHQLSGSGTAYFGVCRHARHARRVAMILRSRQLGLVYATRSCQ